MPTFQERIENDDLFFDSPVISHDAAAAEWWTERLGRQMHEIAIEANTFVLRLVCHDLRVQQLAAGDPVTRKLTPLNGEGN